MVEEFTNWNTNRVVSWALLAHEPKQWHFLIFVWNTKSVHSVRQKQFYCVESNRDMFRSKSVGTKILLNHFIENLAQVYGWKITATFCFRFRFSFLVIFCSCASVRGTPLLRPYLVTVIHPSSSPTFSISFAACLSWSIKWYRQETKILSLHCANIIPELWEKWRATLRNWLFGVSCICS